MCLIHSLYSTSGNTAPTTFSSPLQASVHMTKHVGDPTALCNCYMNHFQLSYVSESKTPYATWYNQLCPSTAVADAKCPVYLPCNADASTPINGLQPAKKPSIHGFRATKILLKRFFFFPSNSISTMLPGELISICAFQLNNS